jgi:hypothetical protein
MNCPKCNGFVTKTYVRESDMYGVSAMPAAHCVNCGKHWFPPVSKAEKDLDPTGKTYKEIGEDLGVTRQAVEQQAKKAMNKLKEACREVCLGEELERKRPLLVKHGRTYKQLS